MQARSYSIVTPDGCCGPFGSEGEVADFLDGYAREHGPVGARRDLVVLAETHRRGSVSPVALERFVEALRPSRRVAVG